MTDRLQELVVSPDAAYVLGRTGAPASQNAWALDPGPGRGDALEHDLILPAIAEIVLVYYLVLALSEHVLEPDFPLVLAPDAKLRIRLTVQDLPPAKLVQMTVGPAHDDLEDPVELIQGHVARRLEPSSDRRPGSTECHLQLVQLLFVCHRFGRPASRMPFPVRLTAALSAAAAGAGRAVGKPVPPRIQSAVVPSAQPLSAAATCQPAEPVETGLALSLFLLRCATVFQKSFCDSPRPALILCRALSSKA